MENQLALMEYTKLVWNTKKIRAIPRSVVEYPEARINGIARRSMEHQEALWNTKTLYVIPRSFHKILNAN